MIDKDKELIHWRCDTCFTVVTCKHAPGQCQECFGRRRWTPMAPAVVTKNEFGSEPKDDEPFMTDEEWFWAEYWMEIPENPEGFEFKERKEL